MAYLDSSAQVDSILLVLLIDRSRSDINVNDILQNRIPVLRVQTEHHNCQRCGENSPNVCGMHSLKVTSVTRSKMAKHSGLSLRLNYVDFMNMHKTDFLQ